MPDETEIERVVDRLQQLHDAGANDADFPFRKETLQATSVVALTVRWYDSGLDGHFP